MSIFKNPFQSSEELWTKTKDGVVLTYPIFCYDPITNDPVIKASIAEVCGDVDFWGWEWDKESRIVDSSGKVFYAMFETSGWRRSGVFPGKVEREMGLEELREIMGLAALERKAVIDNPNELIERIGSSKSIEEILKICDVYF